MVLAYLLPCPYSIFLMVGLSDFSCTMSVTLLHQLLVSPVVLPGRYISASLPHLGGTLSFRAFTSPELARLSGLIYSKPFGYSS